MGTPVTLVDPDGKYVAAASIGGEVAASTTDTGNPVKVGAVYRVTQPTYGDGQRTDLAADSRGNLVTVLASPQSNTLITGAADNADGAAARTTASNLAVLARQAVVNGTTWDRARGDVNGSWVVSVPSAGTGIATTNAKTTALANSLVAKAATGNLYALNATKAAAGWIMVFDATSAPADGAVTPLKVYAVAAGASIDVQWAPPVRLTTGCTVVFSSTGPFTKTAVADGFASVEYK